MADAASPTTRLNKRMAELGLCSRREADDWIVKGWVRVDGRVAVMGLQVGPEALIEVDSQAQGQQSRQVTILLNKPIGYVSGQAEDGHEPAVVLVQERNHWKGDATRQRFEPQQLRGLAPAGRLDIDSTGLLVLTQDGRVARQLIGEGSAMEKEYLVRVSFGSVATDVQPAFPAAQLARGSPEGDIVDHLAAQRALEQFFLDEQLAVALAKLAKIDSARQQPRP